MAKILGYIISIIGLIGLSAALFTPLQESISVLSTIPETILTISSLIVVVVGIFILIKSPSQRQPREVPIYKKDKIVGYRQH